VVEALPFTKLFAAAHLEILVLLVRHFYFAV
jgi:hypothetical protein